MLLNGFFPVCDPGARPYRTQGALREWGLPYASDSAVTRHLADFLRGRPRVDAVLFNGGSVQPPLVRQRLCEQIAVWQDGFAPFTLENDQSALAVARGAARFGALLHHRRGHIAAGVAHAVFLEVQTTATDAGAPPVSLVCVLPWGAGPDELFEIGGLPLEVRTDQPVRFRVYSSSRHDESSGRRHPCVARRRFPCAAAASNNRQDRRVIPARSKQDRSCPSGRADERVGPAPGFLHQRGPREPAVLAIGIQYAPSRSRRCGRAWHATDPRSLCPDRA